VAKGVKNVVGVEPEALRESLGLLAKRELLLDPGALAVIEPRELFLE
jgi:hypothetical protein